MADLVVSDVAALAIAQAIGAQTAAMEKQWAIENTRNTAGLLALQSTGSNLSLIHNQLSSINTRLQELTTATNNVAKKIEVDTTGMASIATQLAKLTTTTQLMAADQIKNNVFQQQTTNKALADAGKEPTVVKQEDLKTSVKASVEDISMIKLQTSAASLFEQAVTETTTEAYTTAAAWAAKTEAGGWLIDQWGKLKVATVSIFSEEKAKQLQAEIDAAKNKAKSGG